MTQPAAAAAEAQAVPQPAEFCMSMHSFFDGVQLRSYSVSRFARRVALARVEQSEAIGRIGSIQNLQTEHSTKKNCAARRAKIAKTKPTDSVARTLASQRGANDARRGKPVTTHARLLNVVSVFGRMFQQRQSRFHTACLAGEPRAGVFS